jgi:hypothetical protein
LTTSEPRAAIFGMSDPLHPGVAIQVRADELATLDPDEVDGYLRGELG